VVAARMVRGRGGEMFRHWTFVAFLFFLFFVFFTALRWVGAITFSRASFLFSLPAPDFGTL